VKYAARIRADLLDDPLAPELLQFIPKKSVKIKSGSLCQGRNGKKSSIRENLFSEILQW
jgi:hypothetical protein